MPSSHASAGSPFALGDVVGERYRLDREAGRSEAGLVFEATDSVSQRRVAVEVATNIEEPQARIRWARDAMMAQRLEGEHILKVLDVGTLPDGAPYAVREIAVATLASEVEARGALPPEEAVGWTLEACEAVAEAHALGMAHGDLGLDNVHLARGQNGMTVKVAWTNAAKAERAAKEDVARDIAGLGALLRVLVTGRFDQDEDGARTLPSKIAHVVARAVAQDTEGTFHNVAELARALAPAAPAGHGSARNVAFMLSRAGIVGGSIPLPPASAADRSGLTDEWFGRASRRSSLGAAHPAPNRRGMVFALVSLALVGFVLGGSWFLWQNGRLPHWTGAAPPEEDVGTTHVTSAPATPAEPASEEPKSTPVEALPNAPPEVSTPAPAPPTAAPRATARPAPKPSSELRDVAPIEAPSETAPPAPPLEEPTPTPSSE
jgi:eukaryotic-like serine/threonine-protein kinase